LLYLFAALAGKRKANGRKKSLGAAEKDTCKTEVPPLEAIVAKKELYQSCCTAKSAESC
jgi:hypothetical protein